MIDEVAKFCSIELPKVQECDATGVEYNYQSWLHNYLPSTNLLTQDKLQFHPLLKSQISENKKASN